MYTKFKFFLSHKLFNIFLFLMMLTSTFGSGNLPVAHAKKEVAQTTMMAGIANSAKGIDPAIVLEMLKEYYGVGADDVSIQQIQMTDSTLFGLFIIPAPQDIETGPAAYYFVAKLEGGILSITPEYTDEFAQEIQSLNNMESIDAEDTVDTNLLDLFTVGDGSSQLSLPWLVNTNANYNWGPHGDGFQPAPTVLSALDLRPSDGKVRAARDGFALQIICSGRTQSSWIIVNHADGWRTSYYHVVNPQVSTSGRNVVRGEYLGDLATNSTDALHCGGSWTGQHVHFALLRNGSQVSIQGVDVGGWTVGGSGSSGTLTRISDGVIRYANSTNATVSNDGTVGSGGSGSSGGPAGYTFCANEGGFCSFSGTADVAFGANGIFNYKYNVASGIACDNNTFGDPIFGTAKNCYYKPVTPPASCTPTSDQIALYEHPNFSGACKLLGVGDYANPGAMGFLNDAASSVKVGSNLKVIFYENDNYSGISEEFNGDDADFGNNTIGHDRVSSVKVQWRACNPGSDQIALYAGTSYTGACVTLGVGQYPNPGALGAVGNDNAESIRVGSSVTAELCQHDNYQGTCSALTSDTTNLGTFPVGGNSVSSIRVQTVAPNAPTLISPLIGAQFTEGDPITLSWSATGSDYFGEVIGGPAGSFTFGWQPETSKNLGPQWAGYLYTWHVKARTGGVESNWSSQTWAFTVFPRTATNLAATPASCNQVNLSWTDNSGSEEGYKVYRDGQVIAALPSGSSSYQNTGLNPNTSYSYTVTAYRGTIESVSSAAATANTPGCQPDLIPDPRPGRQDPIIVSSVSGTAIGDSLYAGKPVYLDWGFKNAGNSDINTNFHVDLYIDDQRIIHYPYASRCAGCTGGFDDWSAAWTSPGWHTVKLVVDPDNTVAESNETNNQWSKALFWNGYDLTVNRTGTGSGTVTSSPAGINCGTDCSEVYAYNAPVTLTASPASGSTFSGWNGGGCTGTGTCTVTITAATSVTANFNSAASYALTVNKTGAGTGTVTSSPSGINCGSSCSYSYSNNTSVTLTATAGAGSTFLGWTGAGCTGTGTCTVNMSAATSVTANFGLQPVTLTVTKAGTGSGTVTSDPAGINCGLTCSYSFASGTSVTLTATPATGSVFSGWSGAGCTGTGPCTIALTSASTVTASFTLQTPTTYTLTVSKIGTGRGNVTSNVGGINCGTTCSTSVAGNSTVTLTASADPGSTFTGWNGTGCSGIGACTVTVTAATTITAAFSDAAAPSLSWVAPVGDGQVHNVTDQIVQLEVSAADNIGVNRVVFSRWDYVNLRSVVIGTVYSSPYRINLDTSTLLPDWNEIDADVYDQAGHVSRKYIWLNRTSTGNTALFYPSANSAQRGGDNNGYEISPANAYADDGMFAVDVNSGSGTSTSCTDKKKDNHIFYNYGINVPGGATIQGIEVVLDAKVGSTAGAPKLCVQVSWNGGRSWTTIQSTGTLSISEQLYTLGGSTDTWGRTWSTTELSNANFRVRIIDVASDTTRDFSLDAIKVQVSYR